MPITPPSTIQRVAVITRLTTVIAGPRLTADQLTVAPVRCDVPRRAAEDSLLGREMMGKKRE